MRVVGLPRTIDHMLFRLPDGWEATLVRVDDRYGSDHYPLLGFVRLEGVELLGQRLQKGE
jgi:hypothetical protein